MFYIQKLVKLRIKSWILVFEGLHTVLNRKIGEVENKIPDHAKYITIPEFKKWAAEHFGTKLK